MTVWPMPAIWLNFDVILWGSCQANLSCKHAYYQDSQAVFSIDPVAMMEGNADLSWLGQRFISLNF
jgi:hypothetical protein